MISKIAKYLLLAVALTVAAASCVKEKYDAPAVPVSPSRDQAVDSLYEPFDFVEVDGLNLTPPAGWVSVSMLGTRIWRTAVAPLLDLNDLNNPKGSVKCAVATGAFPIDTACEFWLVMPPLKVTDPTVQRLSFSTGITYDNPNTTFTVRYSTSYNGGSANFRKSDWIDLKDEGISFTLAAPVSFSTGVPMQASGPIDLTHALKGESVIYIAFCYTSHGSSANWYLDDVKFK